MQYLISKIINCPFPAIILLCFILLPGCIEEFYPKLDEYINLLVINGSIIKEDSIQTVMISRSTRINQPEIIPVSDCQVNVINGNGQKFFFDETSPGIYTAKIPQEYLQFNERFKLQVTAPDGNQYASHFEPILESSPIDSVYYINEIYQSSSILDNSSLQFYVDLKAPDSFTKNYRWTMEETWEYQAPYYLEAKYINIRQKQEYPFCLFGDFYYLPEPWRVSPCWTTQVVKGLYSSSTRNLSVNEKKKIPLNNISKESNKLQVKYCLLIKQYALSDSAYLFWNTNQVETQETGGLYQSQPSQPISNIRNINNPEELILGFFWVSSFTEKRIFYTPPPLSGRNGYPEFCGLTGLITSCGGLVPYNGNGSEDWLVNMRHALLPLDEWDPADSLLTPDWAFADPGCFDCRLNGGVSIKPDFWEE